MAVRIGDKVLVYCRNKEGKDGRNYPRGYIRIKGQLFRLEVNMQPKTQHDFGAIISVTKAREDTSNDFAGNNSGSGWGNSGRNSRGNDF